jgi:DNA polymerase
LRPPYRRILHIDLETRSLVDLVKRGVYVYVEHPSTEILICCYGLDDERVKTWYVVWGLPAPDDLIEWLLDPTITIAAHNAAFERTLLRVTARKKGYLPENVIAALAPVERWSCTAVRSAACGLPRSLDASARALKLPVEKDHVGAALMLQMCVPEVINDDHTYSWKEDADSVETLAAYCRQDVRVEREIDKMLPELSLSEIQVWYATERMNDRGIQLDGTLVRRMVDFVAEAEIDINENISRLTNGQIPKVTSVQKLKYWLADLGFQVPDVGRNTLKDLLVAHVRYEEALKAAGKDVTQLDLPILEGYLPDHVKEVLLLRRDGGRSSAGKFKSAIMRMNMDDRARGSIFYCGAASTGRFSARGLQVQNLSRGEGIKNLNVSAAIDAILGGASLVDIRDTFGPPIVLASDLVRPSFIAKPGHWLARGDYSQIEARVIDYFANAQNMLTAFRQYDTLTGEVDPETGEPLRLGPDIYNVQAHHIVSLLYGDRPISHITKAQRQTFGKVPRLALGFQGGKNAFGAFARLYGIHIPESDAQQIVDAYRESNPGQRALWYVANRAAIECLEGEVGETHWVATRDGDERLENPATGKKLVGDHQILPILSFERTKRCMSMRLPSGRKLVFWYPQLVERQTPWGRPKKTMVFNSLDAQKGLWWTFHAYGGLLVQNAVQAAARDIAAASFVEMDKRGFNPVLLVHDEAVCELSKLRFPHARDAAKAVGDIMMKPVKWMPGLPIACDYSANDRYVKAA